MKTRRLRRAGLAIALTAAIAAQARADEHWIKLPTAPYTLNNKQDAIAFADALTGWYGNGIAPMTAATPGPRSGPSRAPAGAGIRRCPDRLSRQCRPRLFSRRNRPATAVCVP